MGKEDTEIILNDNKEGGVTENKNIHENAQMLLEAEFNLLGENLVAAYKKDDDGYKILLAPTDYESNNGVTIGELVKDINSMLGKLEGEASGALKEEDIEEQIKSANSSFNVENIRIILKKAYLYVNHNAKDDKTTTEYAFELIIDTEKLFPADFCVKVNKVLIAIWNTKREKIVESMSLFDPKAYIEG